MAGPGAPGITDVHVHIQPWTQMKPAVMEAMRRGNVHGESFNLGNGEGFSVRQVIEAVERVTGHEVAREAAARRPGDPATLVASSAAARERLGWRPEFPDLDEIIRTAWRWHESHPEGYRDG